MRSVKSCCAAITTIAVLFTVPLAASDRPQGGAKSDRPAAASPNTAASTAKKATPQGAARTGTSVNTTEEGYTYEFLDDPLSGNSDAAASAHIRVRSRSARYQLIRPRLHFIPELLKSVEMI